LQKDFDGALDARPVAREKLFCGAWIDAVQEAVQVFWTMSLANACETPAERFVSVGTDEEGLTQCTQVETGAADEEWDTATVFDLFDFLSGFARPFTGGVIDVWRNKIDQVMGDALALFQRDFGRGDLDLLIDLDRITVDDLAVKLEGDFDSECAFAGGSWTNDGDDWRFRRHARV
jgi:hypothetical protein